MTKCTRSACQEPLDEPPYFLIYNEPSTGIPKPYCVRCGRKITTHNPELDYETVTNNEYGANSDEKDEV